MTQRPFISGSDDPGPFDDAAPGHPDAGPADHGSTLEQPFAPPSAPSGELEATPRWPADRPSRSGETITETSAPTTDAGYATTDSDPVATVGSSSGAESRVDTAKGEAKQVADTAKGEAKQVADTAVSSGRDVAQTAKDEARNVAVEAKQQAASLLDTVRTEVGQQAGTQQGRIAEALHSLSKELGGMAASSVESGPLTDLAQQASRKGGEVAHWLQEREPADVLEAVRSYGRRRPVTFLALCAVAGVVAGRLTRGVVATKTSLDTRDDSAAAGTDSHLGGTGVTTGLGSNYAAAPATDPVVEPAGMSTGVYGGSVESTEPATGSPYVNDPVVPGAGYVGTTGSLDDPNGDPTR